MAGGLEAREHVGVEALAAVDWAEADAVGRDARARGAAAVPERCRAAHRRAPRRRQGVRAVPVLVTRRPERVVHGLAGGRLVPLVEVARTDELAGETKTQLDQLPSQHDQTPPALLVDLI